MFEYKSEEDWRVGRSVSCIRVVARAPRKQQHADGGRGAIAILEPAKYLTTLVLAGRGCVFSRASSSRPAFLSVRSIPPCEPAADFAPMTHGTDVWQVGAAIPSFSFLFPPDPGSVVVSAMARVIQGLLRCVRGCAFRGALETWLRN